MFAKMKKLVLVVGAMAMAAQAYAGPFSGAATATTDITSLGKAAAAIIGGICTLIGGCITAWKAAHGEEFTKPLIFSIISVAIAAVAALAM